MEEEEKQEEEGKESRRNKYEIPKHTPTFHITEKECRSL